MSDFMYVVCVLKKDLRLADGFFINYLQTSIHSLKPSPFPVKVDICNRLSNSKESERRSSHIYKDNIEFLTATTKYHQRLIREKL